jgi:hypothetical protein
MIYVYLWHHVCAHETIFFTLLKNKMSLKNSCTSATNALNKDIQIVYTAKKITFFALSLWSVEWRV